MLGITRQRLYQLVAMGRIDHKKVGRSVFIPRAAVEDRIAGQQRLESNDCVSAQEVADFFGVDLSTVRVWLADGKLRASKIQNRLCFKPVDVIAFVPPAGNAATSTATRMLNGRHYPLPK